MSLLFENSCKSPTEISRDITFSPGKSKGMTSSPSENKYPTAEKLQKTCRVKPECQGDKEKQEHPDKSNETSNEQMLKKNEEELRKKEQLELQEKEKEMEELKRKEKDAQQELQQQAQEKKTLTARIEELEKEVKCLKAEIIKLKEELEKQKKGSEKQEEELKKLKEENEDERRKKEQEIQEKEKEIGELKRKEKDTQHKLQQKTQENIDLTASIDKLEKEVKCLNARMKKWEEELEEIKGNLFLAAMCDQLQKNFYQIVFYPHDFSKYKQSYQARYIERDIDEGRYGLTTEEKKRQAKESWETLKKNLGWKYQRDVRAIKQLKYDRNHQAHPKITKDMKESLEDDAKNLMLDEPYVWDCAESHRDLVQNRRPCPGTRGKEEQRTKGMRTMGTEMTIFSHVD